MLFYGNSTSLVLVEKISLVFFFCDIMEPASCLYSLLPPPKSMSIISRLRFSQTFPEIYIHTKHKCYFV